MDIDKEQQKREEFRKIIYDLARSQEALEDMAFCSALYERIETLYEVDSNGEEFRHFYSDILPALTQINGGSISENINVLGQNIAILRKQYETRAQAGHNRVSEQVCKALRKLDDHVSLEIARILYSDDADNNISGNEKLQDIMRRINVLDAGVQKAQKHCDDTKEKLDNVQKEHIAILGIFAAVVLAFTGGIAFSTSVLNNIAQASIYRTIFVSLIIGFVLINVLIGLFYYINTLIGKEKKMLPLIISNVLMTLMLGATVIAWREGIVERRNIEIETKLLTPMSVEKSQQ